MLLHSGALTNVTPLRVMNQLEMWITRPYKNVCGFDSKSIIVHGLIKDINVSLATTEDISVLMDIVVTDVPHLWGMFLSTKWSASIGGQLQMDLAYATDEKPFILYRKPHVPKHVEGIDTFPFPIHYSKVQHDTHPVNLQVEWNIVNKKILKDKLRK